MKKLVILTIIIALCLSACSESPITPEQLEETTQATTTSKTTQTEKTTEITTVQKTDKPAKTDNPSSETTAATQTTQQKTNHDVGYSFEHLDFEKLLLEFATDVVVAKYVNHKPFGERKTLMEYEFNVVERVLGSAPKRIFIYTSVENIGENLDALNMPKGFIADIEYLLPLKKIENPIAATHHNGYTFVRGTVINLYDPSRSIMAGNALTRNSSGLEFSKNQSKESIVSYVKELTKNNLPGRSTIKSMKTDDIVRDSPHILVVEINELLEFANKTSDWAAIDSYNVTVVKTLKGDIKSKFKTTMSFTADTVKSGEQHLVAAQPLVGEENDYGWLELTSKNSLFKMEQLSEIEKIIGKNS